MKFLKSIAIMVSVSAAGCGMDDSKKEKSFKTPEELSTTVIVHRVGNANQARVLVIVRSAEDTRTHPGLHSGYKFAANGTLLDKQEGSDGDDWDDDCFPGYRNRYFVSKFFSKIVAADKSGKIELSGKGPNGDLKTHTVSLLAPPTDLIVEKEPDENESVKVVTELEPMAEKKDVSNFYIFQVDTGSSMRRCNIQDSKELATNVGNEYLKYNNKASTGYATLQNVHESSFKNTTIISVASTEFKKIEL